MRDGEPARDSLLKAAAELFYRDGITSTGINSITARAGVAKMSLYNNFASKSELVNAYLEARHEEWEALLHSRLSRADTPLERILAVFDSYVDHAALAKGWGFRGCGLYNAAAELPAGDPGRAIVARQKGQVVSLFKLYLLQIHPHGTKPIDETAEHLSFVLEGAMLRAGLEGNDDRLASARDIAISIVDTL